VATFMNFLLISAHGPSPFFIHEAPKRFEYKTRFSKRCSLYIEMWDGQHPRWNCALLGYYAARSDDPLPTFRNNLSVPLYGSIILRGGDR